MNQKFLSDFLIKINEKIQINFLTNSDNIIIWFMIDGIQLDSTNYILY